MTNELLPRHNLTPLALEDLLEFGEEEIWAKNKGSKHTERAYRGDVRAFMQFFKISHRTALRSVGRMAAITWKEAMEQDGLSPRTIRRRLAALSSLFRDLYQRGLVEHNPFREVVRPRIARGGVTQRFTEKDAARLLNAPQQDTLQGIRDRAILSVLLQAGLRRSEVANLLVESFCSIQRREALWFIKKGGEEHKILLHPETARRIREYLHLAGHKDERKAPLFRPITGPHWKNPKLVRPLCTNRINEIVQGYARKLSIAEGCSAHSCRVTFVTSLLKKGVPLEDIRQTVGHADSDTTRGYNRNEPEVERSATLHAEYNE